MGRTMDVQGEKSQELEASNVVTELLKQAGGCVATDGGFATQLERHGADINDPLWSALCLITMPDLIRTVINWLFTEIYPVYLVRLRLKVFIFGLKIARWRQYC